jgi:hypothetical protein
VVVFPLLATLISLACAGVIARDAFRRVRPEKIVWAIAFTVFALAAGAKTASMLWEWTPLLARTYYLAGAVLVVAYLAIGELYLLAGRRVASVAPGAMLLLTALAGAAVWNAPIDEARLASDGWEAIDRGSGLGILAALLNSVGTLILVGGVLYSAWRFKQLGTHRHRMIGCLLIAVGTVIVAVGGTATRFGHEEYYYIAMSIGVSIIFAGYLQTRRSDRPRVAAPDSVAAAAGEPVPSPARASLIPLPANKLKSGANGRPGADPAIAFIEARFLPLEDEALSEICRVWSVNREERETFSREDARRVWALRLRLSADGQKLLDAHAVPSQRQVAELYHEVLAPGVADLAATAGK